MTMLDPGGRRDLGWWRCTSWISGAITTENQFRNCDRQPRLAAVVHHARVYYEMLLHFIDDWNEAVGRVEWGIKGFIFWGLAIARPRIKPRHSTRPTDSFQSSVGNFFLIPLAATLLVPIVRNPRRYSLRSYLLLTQDFSLYWRLEITFSDLRTKWVNHL